MSEATRQSWVEPQGRERHRGPAMAPKTLDNKGRARDCRKEELIPLDSPKRLFPCSFLLTLREKLEVKVRTPLFIIYSLKY